MRKGIILAGGSGTRLHPITIPICKQLLPIYDKPMIYYPMSTLMLAGIRDILIISTAESTPHFQKLFGDGSHLGLNIQYKIQHRPNGIAQAFVLGEDFIQSDSVCLVLGDNLFHGNGFSNLLKSVSNDGATVFGYYVKDPQRFGVVEFDDNGCVKEIVEKPTNPKSNYAVTGLYFYDNSVVEKAKTLKPSARGEYEITDINKLYLKEGKLNVKLFGRGFAWLDTGTFDSLLEASNYVNAIQKCQGRLVSCLEEIAYNMKYISKEQFINIVTHSKNNDYISLMNRICNEM